MLQQKFNLQSSKAKLKGTKKKISDERKISAIFSLNSSNFERSDAENLTADQEIENDNFVTIFGHFGVNSKLQSKSTKRLDPATDLQKVSTFLVALWTYVIYIEKFDYQVLKLHFTSLIKPSGILRLIAFPLLQRCVSNFSDRRCIVIDESLMR